MIICDHQIAKSVWLSGLLTDTAVSSAELREDSALLAHFVPQRHQHLGVGTANSTSGHLTATSVALASHRRGFTFQHRLPAQRLIDSPVLLNVHLLREDVLLVAEA